jgi:hypothetical protein
MNSKPLNLPNKNYINLGLLGGNVSGGLHVKGGVDSLRL